MIARRALLTLLGLLAVVVGPVGAEEPAPPTPRSAATAWLAALTPAQRGKANLPWNAPQRGRWDYRPHVRAGLALREMDARQRALAETLWRTCLSEAGLAEVQRVFRREAIQQQQLDPRTRARNPLWRDPGLYYLALFGSPGPGSWSWRLGGHHLSIHLVFRGDELVDATPYVLGGSPAAIRTGGGRSEHVMGAEADLARRLVASLDAKQRALALDGRSVPGDVQWPDGTPSVGTPGVRGADLGPEERPLLAALLEAVRDGPRKAPWSEDVMQARFWWRGNERDQWFFLVTPHATFEYRDLGNHLHAVLRRRADGR